MDEKLDKIQGDLESDEKQFMTSNYVANFPADEAVPPKHKNKFVWLFSLVGIIVLVLGFSYIYGNISGSVSYDIPGWVQDQLTQNNNDTQNIEELKNNDTDQDGLTDYQELYQYRTSMFLPDTDSDGYSDYEEATSGHDPLCPKGQNCNLLKLITPQTKLSEIVQDVALDPELTLQDAVVAELRKFLLENGITQEELDNISDEELLMLFEALEKSGIIPEDQWSATTTPDQVKAFLLTQPNADLARINSMTEAELIEIRDKILE